MPENSVHRNYRKARVGRVISDKADKSIVVRVDRRMKHPRYSKTVGTFSKYYAHDEKNEANIGDVVKIMETRPLSATKRWRLVEIVEKAK
ncbi:MAG: 30S ribosomal protein S17 [candidate division Zixibacteria bacterium]|nr:30S ribosomal protein S17 [candidate division Zixibacteria bacterium]